MGKNVEGEALKKQLNELFAEMKAKREEAREAYRVAGECTTRIAELMGEIANGLKTLEKIYGKS